MTDDEKDAIWQMIWRKPIDFDLSFFKKTKFRDYIELVLKRAYNRICDTTLGKGILKKSSNQHGLTYFYSLVGKQLFFNPIFQYYPRYSIDTFCDWRLNRCIFDTFECESKPSLCIVLDE